MASIHLKTTTQARKRILDAHRKDDRSNTCVLCNVQYPCIYAEMVEDTDQLGTLIQETIRMQDRLDTQAATITEQANKIRGLQAEVQGKELGLAGYRPVVAENEALRETVRLLRENNHMYQMTLARRVKDVGITDLGDAIVQIEDLRAERKSRQKYIATLEEINQKLRGDAAWDMFLRSEYDIVLEKNLQLEAQLGERQRDDIQNGQQQALEDEVEDKIFLNLRMQNERLRLSMQRIDPLWRIHHSPSRVENYVETLETRLDRALMMLEHGVTIQDVPEGYDLDEEGFYAAEPSVDSPED